MKRLLGLILLVASAAVFAMFAGSGASAQEGIYVDPAASDAATDIVNGRILSTTSVELDGEAFRVSEMEITSSLKGSLTGTILVETPGGERADGTIVYVSHTPKLVAGDMVQLAINERVDAPGANLAAAMGGSGNVYSVTHGINGAYGLLSDGLGRAAAVGDYSLTGAQWASFSPAVGYKVNPANSGLDSANTIAAVRRAFDLWEDDGGSDIDFVYEGTTSRSGLNLSDDQNTISWVSTGSGWLAQASWIATSNGDIIGFDVRVSRSFSWSNGPASGRYDIATVVGHEVGHGIGFGHAPASSELMYFQITQGRSKGLGPGDASGAAFLYPTSGPTCGGFAVTVNLQTGQGSAGEGRDVILGTDGNDTIRGYGGDDVICGGLGVDTIYGGHGNDVIYGGGGSDRIYGQAGADEIHAGSGADRVWGGPASDTIFGNGGQDSIWGEDGNDDIQGNWESDKIWGGPGNDILRGAGGKDKIYGQEGNDFLFGGLNTDYLNGGSGSDNGNGQQGADRPLVPGVSGCEQLAIASSC